MKKLILLNTIEHFERYTTIEKNFLNNSSIKIYAFTIEIRHFLKSKNIKYFIHESYISDIQAEKMDDIAYHITKNWHKDLFKFKGISLGILIHRSIYYHFCKIIKYLQIFLTLIEIEKPAEIIAFRDNNPHIEQFNSCLKYVCSLKKISLNLISKRKSSSTITNDLNKNIISIFKKIATWEPYKCVLGILFSCINALKELNYHMFKRNKKKNVLACGYNYKIINKDIYWYHLSVIKKIHQNYYLTILDTGLNISENYDILHIFTRKRGGSYDFIESYESKKIKKQMDFFFNESLNKWKKIIEEPSFQEIFIYNSLSFWPIFKEDLNQSIFPTFKILIKNILMFYKILKKKKYDLLIFEADTRVFDKCLSIIASKMNIPSLVMQHGATGHQIGFLPSFCKILAVWGNISRDFLKNHGMDPNRIVITGSPRYDELVFLNKKLELKNIIKNSTFQKFNIKKNQKLILLITTHSHFYNINSSADLNHYEIEKMLKISIKAIKNLPNTHLIIKLRTGDPNIGVYLKMKEDLGIKNVSITNNFKLRDLIIASDSVITGHSTAILECMLLEKPIIIINFRKSTECITFLNDNIVYKASNYEELLHKIKESFKNPVPLNEYKKYLENYIFKIDGGSTKRVLEFIKSMIQVN